MEESWVKHTKIIIMIYYECYQGVKYGGVTPPKAVETPLKATFLNTQGGPQKNPQDHGQGYKSLSNLHRCSGTLRMRG